LPGNLVRTNAEAFFNETNGQPIHFQLLLASHEKRLSAGRSFDHKASSKRHRYLIDDGEIAGLAPEFIEPAANNGPYYRFR
jgi:hypothetical protein